MGWPNPRTWRIPTGMDLHPDDVRLSSGLIRGSTAGKINYLLALDGPMFERWAALLSAAADRKGARNWMLAHTEEDLERFREGLARHTIQYLRGDTDEDHAAAMLFNLNGAEYVRARLEAGDGGG